jgi:endoglucanase
MPVLADRQNRGARGTAGAAAGRVATATTVHQALAHGSPTAHPWVVGPYHTIRSNIVDSRGHPVRITGVNWFGLETCSFAPHGLWARNWRDMLDQVRALGYNTIRLPFSEQLLDPHSMPTGINYVLNPDLQGLNGLQVMDRIIAGAGARGLKVILDQHRESCGNGTETALWYTHAYPQSTWLAVWRALARRYRHSPAVIGADLHNEPHGSATWGDGNPATDWRLAAERAGNAILRIAPRWLIVVEGIERVEDDWYWWGGNLSLAGRYPVRLDRPGRLVYEAHDYGPGVAPQAWFHDPRFPRNLPSIWQSHWAYLMTTDTAPVFVGEFGGQSVGDDAEGLWQRTLVAYLRTHHIGYTYWALNPDSGDTGGLLQANWHSVDTSKQAVLATTQAPLLGPPTGRTDLLAIDSSTPTIALPAAPASVPVSAATTASPPPAQASTPPGGVTIGVAGRSPSVGSGRLARMALTVVRRSPLVGGIVDVEIYDAHSAKVFQTWRTPVTLTAGRAQHLTLTWAVPPHQDAGTYTVKAGVFAAAWSRLYAWNDAVASLTVGAGPAAVLHTARSPRTAGRAAPRRSSTARAAHTGAKPIPAVTRSPAVPRRTSGTPGPGMAGRSPSPALPRGTGLMVRTPMQHRGREAHRTRPLTARPGAPSKRVAPARPSTPTSTVLIRRARPPRRPHSGETLVHMLRIAPSATIVVRTPGLRLHVAPHLDAPVWAVLNAGMTLRGDRLTPHWLHVSVVGSALSGWVLRSSVPATRLPARPLGPVAARHIHHAPAPRRIRGVGAPSTGRLHPSRLSAPRHTFSRPPQHTVSTSTVPIRPSAPAHPPAAGTLQHVYLTGSPTATITVRVAGVRLHSSPRLDAPVWAVLNAGVTLRGDRLTPHWLHVSVVGSALSGWVLRSSVGR